MNMDKKICEIEEYKASTDGGKFYIAGYANTKNKPDAYGDIPKGDNVYDLTRLKKNPVALVDHKNSAAMIAGNFVKLKEDDKGLYFKVLLRNLDDIHNPMVKDAVSAYMTGFGRALSIGGRWLYEDEKNPTHLTKAIIHEISLVGVGADERALSNMDYPKAAPQTQAKDSKAKKLAELEAAVKAYREHLTTKNLEKITEVLK